MICTTSQAYESRSKTTYFDSTDFAILYFSFLIDDNTVLFGQVLCCNVFFLAALNGNEVRIFL